MAIAANPSGKSFRSLRTRIVVGLVASVWLVLGLYSVLTIVYRQDQLESALQDRSQRLVTLMAGALARPMYDFNSLAVESAVNALATDHDIVSVSVLDSQKVEIAAAGAPRVESGKALTVTQQIIYRDHQRSLDVGEVTLTLSRTSLEAELRVLIINSLAVNALLALVLVVVIMLIFRSLARPFRDILLSMDKLRQGNVQIELSGLDRQDEIGHLSEAVLKFREALVSQRLAEDETQALLAEKMRF